VDRVHCLVDWVVVVWSIMDHAVEKAMTHRSAVDPMTYLAGPRCERAGSKRGSHTTHFGGCQVAGGDREGTSVAAVAS
jgi:hypothetical protein